MTAVMPERTTQCEFSVRDTQHEFSARDALALDLYKLFLQHGVPCDDVPTVRYLVGENGEVWGVTIQAFDRSDPRPAGGVL